MSAPAAEVWSGFDKKLFEALSPKFPKVRLLRFDGCEKGDEVHLELVFPFFVQNWNSQIIESGKDHRGYYFIDQGIQLPFFLTYWEHKHHIKKSGEETIIADEIYFKAYNFLFECLIYPVLWLTFIQRKPIYKRIFKKKQS